MRGRVRPWGSHWLRDLCQRVPGLWSQSEPHGLSRPLTASHNLSCDLSEPIRGARPLTHTASQICEAVGVRDLRVRSASHAHRSDSTGRSNAFSREISQIAPRIGLSAGVVRLVCVRGQSDSQICGRPCA